MLEILLFIVAFIGSTAAGFYDLKTTEIPDEIPYVMIAIGIIGSIIASYLSWSYWPFVYSMVAGLGFLGFGFLMYYLGQWGGGDAKLLVGYGAVLPVFPTIFKSVFSPVVAPWPFILTLWFNISIFGVIFGFLYAVKLAMKNRYKFAPEARKMLQKYKIILYVIFIGLLFVFVGFFSSQDFGYLLAGTWASFTLMFYIIILLKSVENSCMYKFVKPTKLEEGDWVVEFRTPCIKLDKDNKCRIYDKRPSMCRKHKPETCVKNGDEEVHKIRFDTLEEVDDYIEKVAKPQIEFRKKSKKSQ